MLDQRSNQTKVHAPLSRCMNGVLRSVSVTEPEFPLLYLFPVPPTLRTTARRWWVSLAWSNLTSLQIGQVEFRKRAIDGLMAAAYFLLGLVTTYSRSASESLANSIQPVVL
jgi:hypothetical protein